MTRRSPAAARLDPPVRKWQGLAPTDLGPTALQAWLCAEAALDAAAWDALLRHQGLWIDRHRWAGQAASAGARATVYAFTTEPEPPEITEEDILLDLGDVVAVAKPAWLCTQGSRATATLSVEAQVARLLGRHLIAAHRLDRETSGVLLLSAPGRVAGALHAGFRAATVEKVYHAVVRPPLAAPRDVEGPMRRVLHPSHSQFTLGSPGDEGVDSFTAFRPLDADLVEARPRTGRTHQIRVHLA
ncbi:MAG: RNA pseudouridine synthase, partial [Myxococcales bacterium]|nr:RNA pseudouridine synthase [Myxococcales bacterium]